MNPTPRIASLALLALAAVGSAAPSIVRTSFGKTKAGVAVELFTLTSSSGASAKITTYGATLTDLRMPDKEGRMGSVILGFDDIASYEKQTGYIGAIAGRYANRIAGGRFRLDGQTYRLAQNNGPNSLHGGLRGYDKRVWQATAFETRNGPAVRLRLTDPDGSEGFPGRVNVEVTYTLTHTDSLVVDYRATTTKATPFNPTQHAYFNLKDGGRTPILAHELSLTADRYTPVNSVQIPTGRLAPVSGTPFDFRVAKPIGRDLAKTGGSPAGYDHNYVLGRRTGKGYVAAVREPETGRSMLVRTTEPGLQLYTGNFLDGTLKGRSGNVYKRHHGFCLEAQKFPDSPNRPAFPSSILRPGRPYRQMTVYQFAIAE